MDLFLSDALLEPVLAPVFDLDCEDGCYYSHLVGARAGVAAINSLSSRSGLSALLTVCEPTALVLTGSHLASLRAVRQGVADMACIDAVTWRILERDAPSCLGGLPVLERSDAAPAPPFVVRSAGRRDVAAALVGALSAPATAPARRALLLRGTTPVTLDDYAPVLAEYRAVADRIPDLRERVAEPSAGSAVPCGHGSVPDPL